MKVIEKDSVMFRGDSFVSKEGKYFGSKNAAVRYYIKEKLDEGRVVTYNELYRYLTLKVKIDWLQNYGTLLNQFIYNEKGYKRIDRGRYVRGTCNKQKDKTVDYNMLRAFNSKKDGTIYYVEEKLSDGYVHKWKDIRDYVNKKLPSDWVKGFSSTFSNYVNENDAIINYGNGQYALKRDNKKDEIISREGKTFKSKSEGMRYYVKDELSSGVRKGRKRIYNNIKKRVPADWMPTLYYILNKMEENGELEKTKGNDYALKTPKIEKAPYEVDGKAFSSGAGGIRYYITEYFEIVEEVKYSEIEKYVGEKVPEEWMTSYPAAFAGLVNKNVIEKVSRGLYRSVGEAEVTSIEKDSKENNESNKQAEGLDKVVEGIKKELGNTQDKVSDIFNEVKFGDLDTNEIEKLLELKVLTDEIGEIVGNINKIK